jgi:hypothetical protein
VLDPFIIVTLLVEVLFVAALGRYVWQRRANNFVFYGWIAVIAILAVINYFVLRQVGGVKNSGR